MSSKNNQKRCCSFCGTKMEEYSSFFSKDDVIICSPCIENFIEYLNEPGEHRLESKLQTNKIVNFPTPRELKEELDKYVIGQNEAKKVLSVAVYNHYQRIFCKESVSPDVEIEKSNVLLLGPSGSGKTLLAKTLANKIKVPFAIADATTLTEAGYVGDDVENILLRLIQAANGDVKLAETGIIFLDEIDKIARKSENTSITRDVSGEGVQQALLKIVEGTIATVPENGGRKHPQMAHIKIDTKNILFICGGAFVGLEKIVKNRISKKSIGFESENKEITLEKLYKNIHPDDLVQFGLIPELIGRLPVYIGLNELDKKTLIKIIKEPKNSILNQLKEKLKLDNCVLDFQDDAIEAVAEKALEQKTGARGIRSIIEDLMLDVMFEIPSKKGKKKITVTKENIINKTTPNLDTVA